MGFVCPVPGQTLAVQYLERLAVRYSGALRLCGVDPFVTSVAVVPSAMPVATNGIMLCLQYGQDERVMTQGLFLTTLFSVLSIPLMAYLTSLL